MLKFHLKYILHLVKSHIPTVHTVVYTSIYAGKKSIVFVIDIALMIHKLKSKHDNRIALYIFFSSGFAIETIDDQNAPDEAATKEK